MTINLLVVLHPLSLNFNSRMEVIESIEITKKKRFWISLKLITLAKHTVDIRPFLMSA